MEKKTNKYRLILELKQYANGDTEPYKIVEIDFENHDEIFNIIDRVTAKNPFNDTDQAVQFALGLKLFSEVLIKNRTHPVFEDLNEAFSVFMKKVKSL